MEIKKLITMSLAEDIQEIDVTSSLLIDSDQTSSAQIVAKESGIFFGTPIINEMNNLSNSISIQSVIPDGSRVNPNDICVSLKGNLKEILQYERTLLNFLQRLSGIATTTHSFVKALNNPAIEVLDTRKTTPLLRDLEKMAVKAGGGCNHRFGLYDMILVKENHLKYYLSSSKIDEFNIRLANHKKEFPNIKIEVEIDTIDLLKQLDLDPIDIILFDNMDLNTLKECLSYIELHSYKVLTEVSGNINLETIKNYQNIDINRISVGSLTHSVKALDLSLLVL